MTPPRPLGPRRRLVLLLSWSLVLLVLLTLQTGAPFTLLEPLSVEQGVAVILFLMTSAFWVPRWRRSSVVHAHLAVVLSILALHPLTTAFGRDGASVVGALYAGLVVAWLTSWRPEWKLLLLALVVGMALVETILSALPERPVAVGEGLSDYGELMGPYGRGGFLIPGLSRQVVGPEGPVEFVTNRHGFRNRDHTPRRKPAGRRRLLIVGDSFVAGYRTDQERTVGRALELRLREQTGRETLEVLVAGAGHPAAARAWLRRHGFRFQPDLVILGVTLGNDPAQTSLARRGQHVALLESLFLPDEAYPRHSVDLLPVKLDRTLRSWRVYRRVRRLLEVEVISSWFHDYPTRVHLLDPGHGLGLFCSRRPHPVAERAVGDLIDELADIQRECAARQVPLLVMVIPQRFQITTREWRATVFRYGLDPEAFDDTLPNRLLMAGCDDRQVECLDLLPGFRAEGAQTLYQPLGDMHWNDAGHALAGRLLAEEIARRFPALVSDEP